MKRLTSILHVALLAAPLLLLGACGSKKSVVADKPAVASADTVEQKAFMQRVHANVQTQEFVTSKVKFAIEVGQLKQSFTGNLKMKRNDVIRLQLMAFGFVEAARLEFTPDQVLIMDRINKQYLRVPYHYVDFLRESGINFYTLQALFWNELFLPNHQSVAQQDMDAFTTMAEGDNMIVSYDDAKAGMNYSWLASKATGRISMANIAYQDRLNNNATTQLNWDYRHFAQMGRKHFPDNMGITVTTPKKELKLSLELNYLGNDSDWETRTNISGKYNEVEIDEILRRFMAL